MKESMSKAFKGYSKYSQSEYKQIWKEGLIVIDTNILLNFYRYSNETRKELYKTLEAVQDRLWIPFQVANEYFNNKKSVIVDTHNTFDELLSETKSCFDKLSGKITMTAAKRLECKDSILDKLKKYKEEIHNIISQEKESKKEDSSEEKVEELIFKLFNNSIGEKIIGDEYEEIKREGLNRIKNKIPPGYKDSDKEENGDYYIFYSMIKHSKENKKHIIFVTDDTKEDWFIRMLGEKKGGDYRLLNEFYKETGKLILIYTSDGFLTSYQENVNKNKKVDEEVLSELISTRKLEMKKDKIYKFSYKNEEIAREIRNILNHEKLNDTRILNELIRNYYELDDIEPDLKRILYMLHLSYEKNNDILKLESIKELEQYLSFCNNDKYRCSRKIESKIKILKIIDHIDYLIKYNKEFDKDKFCDIFNNQITYLLNIFEDLDNFKEKFLLIDKIKDLKKLFLYARNDKSVDESFIKIYLPSKIQETLEFIKEQLK